MQSKHHEILQQFLISKPSVSGLICRSVKYINCTDCPMNIYINSETKALLNLLIMPGSYTSIGAYTCIGLILQEYYKGNVDDFTLKTAYHRLTVKRLLNLVTHEEFIEELMLLTL